ncbi:MAG: carboxypeptidase-like regulatory domain-containing protein, partial [Tunicatimonas sp.]|uniref:carboxypeptidase-like regulatory domain-containing protein n=1 Tax=Tunicatimonas sp. TaxID=1940096 RepID=UPI003C72B8CB
MKYRILLFLVLVSSSLAYAQFGTIQGRVTDEKDNPLPGFAIELVGTTLGSVTDINGEFAIQNSPIGSLQIRVSGIGYRSRSRVVNVVANETLIINFSMQESLTQLQEVEIIGRPETTYQNDVSFLATKTATPLQDVPQSVSYVTKELILDQAAFRVNDVVKNMSGVNQFSFYNDIT